jgi:hypothetical protein
LKIGRPLLRGMRRDKVENDRSRCGRGSFPFYYRGQRNRHEPGCRRTSPTFGSNARALYRSLPSLYHQGLEIKFPAFPRRHRTITTGKNPHGEKPSNDTRAHTEATDQNVFVERQRNGYAPPERRARTRVHVRLHRLSASTEINIGPRALPLVRRVRMFIPQRASRTTIRDTR